MAILVIGGTGMIGSLVVEELARRGADVVALGTKAPAKGLPAGARLVTGDLMDVDFMRDLLGSIGTVFLLNAGVPDELARALLVVSLIKEAGIKRLVFLSMMGADRFTDSSRAASKLAAEQAIEEAGIPATILRPNALFQNDTLLRSAIMEDHVYATPLGNIGVTLLDGRDLAEVAATELIRRDASTVPLPSVTMEVVGPEVFTGTKMAKLWSDILGVQVAYAGDDLDVVERGMRQGMPAASAYDLKLIFRGILREGVVGTQGAAAKIEAMLGRPLRTYGAFARERQQ